MTIRAFPPTGSALFLFQRKTLKYIQIHNMKTEKLSLKRVSVNKHNPRTITERKMSLLIESILTFPKMLEVRPVVVDNASVALGGNMRLQALSRISAMSLDEIGNILGKRKEYMSKSEGEKKAHIIERGVPTPTERLEAIERIANAGAGGATLRLRPFIVGVSTPNYLQLIREAADRGATAVSTEFFCVEQRSPTLKAFMPTLNELCGFDVMEFYKKYSVAQGYLRLNRKIKEPFFRNMKVLCDEVGMRFYVSDAHFKELCHNGSCCGLPQSWNYSRGQFCEALQICKEKGEVRWSDISQDIYTLHKYDWGRADGFNCNSSEKRAKFMGMTMADYMRWLWNNPQSGQNPYKMFYGVMYPDGNDEEGNLIYKYNKQRTIK